MLPAGRYPAAGGSVGEPAASVAALGRGDADRHITDAFAFELSKCDETAIRTRTVAALRNVDEDLARSVADGLGLAELPDALPPAREPVRDLAAFPALSILANGPDSFAGRKLGILITDGADAAKLAELTGFRPACIRYLIMAVYRWDEDQRWTLAQAATLIRDA
jgi:hypothetical protein